MDKSSKNNNNLHVIGKNERERILSAVDAYVENHQLVPPLSMEELRHHASAVSNTYNIDPELLNFVTVLTGNRVWREIMASIPFERRVLLLPKCLRSHDKCPAELDEFGLLCEECGRCHIGKLQHAAEELGYVVLIAEGTTVVTKLLESGKVDAVIGVSCFSTLERSFPHMSAEAIPGIAIPLLFDGCVNTEVDFDWIMQAIQLKSNKRWFGRHDFEKTRADLNSWFNYTNLARICGAGDSQTEEIAVHWLAKSGKRWRPLLAVCVYQSLSESSDSDSEEIKRLAVAVECFHKASLVHDDIEDDSSFRYGDMTLHIQHGTPVALNTGDLLLGMGYSVIANGDFDDETKNQILRVAAEGHLNLCIGQGAELCWMRKPTPLSVQSVLDIFRNKTAPAFNVALQIGAIAGGADQQVRDVLTQFSDALGIAYQIKDDIEDFLHEDDSDSSALRPSLILALTHENMTLSAEGDSLINPATGEAETTLSTALAVKLATELQVEEKAQQLLAHYRNEAVRALIPLRNAHLKTFLRRIVSKILG